jgi:hypothetical protein
MVNYFKAGRGQYKQNSHFSRKGRARNGAPNFKALRQRFDGLEGVSQTLSEAAGPRETVPVGVERVRVWS